jgi:hypothetical protein
MSIAKSKHMMTRQEAMAAGDKFYFSGKPCRKGHVARRRKADNRCSSCLNECNSRARQKEDPSPDPELYRQKSEYLRDEMQLKRELEDWADV